MFAFFASFTHGTSTVLAWLGVFLLVVHRSPMPDLLLASGFSLILSWLLSGAAKRALICRTFHSPNVEKYILQRLIPALHGTFRTVLVSNAINPDRERRYTPGALAGMVCSALGMGICLANDDLSILQSLFVVSIAILATDRWYAFRLRETVVQRRRIAEVSNSVELSPDVLRFADELRSPGWQFRPRYVTNLPAARIEVACPDSEWFQLVAAGMCAAALTVIDITDVVSSPGLAKELRLALRLIAEDRISDCRLLLLCAYDRRESVLEYLMEQYGLPEAAVLFVGDPKREHEEHMAIAARANAA